MSQKHLTGLRVAVLAADGFEQVELTQPVETLIQHGASVEIVSIQAGKIQGMNHLKPGKKVKVDRTISHARTADYDALLMPGGLANPDTLRQNREVLDFVRSFDQTGKPIAAICHAPWVLISAGLVRGRRLTSWPAIQDDIRNAGGVWEDRTVVKDDNWITSRSPHDLPSFDEAILQHFAPQGSTREQESDEHAAQAPGSKLATAGKIAASGVALAAIGAASVRLGQEVQP